MPEWSSEETQDALADLADPTGSKIGGLPYPAGNWEANRAAWHGGELPTPKLPEQPDPRQPPVAEDYPYGTKVDAGAQALVWALTASQHGSELIEALTAKRVREDSGRIPSAPTAEEFLAEGRAITYYEKVFRVAERLAGMWSLVASSQPFEDVMIDSEQGE